MDTKDEDIVGQPNPVDIYVGSRLKLRRLILGISQKKWLKNWGLPFNRCRNMKTALTASAPAVSGTSASF